MRTAHSRASARCIAVVALTLLSLASIVQGSRELHKEEEDPMQYVLSSYLNNDALEAHMQDFSKRCKSISRLVSVGKSVMGRELYVLEISDKPGTKEAEPNFKYVGNLHGNEPTGRVLTLALAEYLCANYKTDPVAGRIVKDMHLWLMPTANPDGFTERIRYNHNKKDLNRDFPDRFSNTTMEPTGTEQPETLALMNWLMSTKFVGSAAFHEGALVANYPWDGTANRTTYYEKCPDDATFIHLAKTYANNHATMALSSNREFAKKQGITNGADWYPIYGSMQDWNYIKGKCLEITLEVSMNKYPDASTLAQLWEINKESLLQLPIVAALGGLRGTVRGQTTSIRKGKGQEIVPIAANISIVGIDFFIESDSSNGAYFRALAPGKYTMRVQSQGYKTEHAEIEVPDDNTGVKQDFVLLPSASTSVSTATSTKAKSTVGMLKSADGTVLEPLQVARLSRDSFILLISGVLLFYSLWLVHKRIVRKSLSTTRERSI